jgi:predicted ATPase
MLRRFEVENFASIRERQALDLNVDKYAPSYPNRLVPAYPGSSDRITRVAALFGANASGKSNTLKALSFLIHFARGAEIWSGGLPAFFTFSNAAWRTRPTRLYAEFDAQIVSQEEICLHTYEVKFEIVGDKKAVTYESLKYFPHGKARRLIERRDDSFYVSSEFGIRRDDQRLGYVGNSRSVFPVLAQFNHQLSANILQGLGSIQSNINALNRVEFGAEVMTSYYNQNPKILEQLCKRVRVMDLGIEDIRIEKQTNRMGALFTHKGLDAPIVLEFESEGTQGFYRMFAPIAYVLSVGGLAVIDEFDRDIHPLLLPEIIGWFHNPEMNPKNAQLVMTCHNATLLEYLVKEEVFFTEKTQEGATHLFALQDMKGVRRDANLYAKYLAGAFGAVPRVG